MLPDSPENIVSRIFNTCINALNDVNLKIEDISSIGIGTPGAVDSAKGIVVFANNLGLKTNIAEISEDADDHGNSITDIDSTPNNQVDGEDDQDNAPVILTIKTGETTIYTGVIIASIAIIGLGVFCIKKYVLK